MNVTLPTGNDAPGLAAMRREIEQAFARVMGKGEVNEKLILRSPDGTLWQVTVDNAGTLATTAL